MSYDLMMFEPQPDVDPEITLNAILDDEVSEEPLPSLSKAESDKRNRQIIEALQGLNPNLEDSHYDSYIEIEDKESTNGIRITLFGATASVSVPYWHKGPAARQVLSEMWDYLDAMHHVAGYLAYDSQLGMIVCRRDDFDAMVDTYAHLVERHY
ncbi:MAG TPA: hypothetical protein VMT34_00645 [Aggregatilineales bacterium]|nr:hypothetical protein [Aggregatilineales bacterium]